MAKIIFILPAPSRVPTGGHRVVYEYANWLARKHCVKIIYVISTPYREYKNYKYIPVFLRYFIYKLFFMLKWYNWYKFENIVEEKVMYQLQRNTIASTDIVIATFWSTAYAIKILNTKNKYYLVQSYEVWAGKKNNVDKSYMLGLNNIVISKWLKNKIEEIGGDTYAYIPNGIDLKKFKTFVLPNKRDDFSIAMMYHLSEGKGSINGLEALIFLKEKYPQLRVTFFSVFPRPKHIPKWIHYIENPPLDCLVGIYNNHAIFLSTSWSEGFCLPGAEAMACGCALVTTDNNGCMEYAKNNITALVSKPKDVNGLVLNVDQLLSDNGLRIKLATLGNQFIRNFSKEQANRKLEKVLGLR